MNKDTSRVGDLAEFYAVTWLWDNGFEVYQNSGSTGPVDIVAIKNGKVWLFDIKSKKSELNWGFTRTFAQEMLGVQILVFNPRTRKMRFVKHRKHNEGIL